MSATVIAFLVVFAVSFVREVNRGQGRLADYATAIFLFFLWAGALILGIGVAGALTAEHPTETETVALVGFSLAWFVFATLWFARLVANTETYAPAWRPFGVVDLVTIAVGVACFAELVLSRAFAVRS